MRKVYNEKSIKDTERCIDRLNIHINTSSLCPMTRERCVYDLHYMSYQEKEIKTEIGRGGTECVRDIHIQSERERESDKYIEGGRKCKRQRYKYTDSN